MTITDTQMLRAAQRALAQHQAMRPATSAELSARAHELRAVAAALESVIEPPLPTISSMIDRGERGTHVVELSHQLGRIENARVKAAMARAASATRLRMTAHGYDEAAQMGDGGAYAETLRVLSERVEFYAARANAS